MAIEIVRRGKAKPDEITCKGCDSVISYEDEDVEKYSGRDISGGPDGHWRIKCPVCRKMIYIRSW